MPERLPRLADCKRFEVNTRKLFQKISQRLRVDFEASAHVVHAVSKGTIRENSLRSFLAEGRLPTKYGLGMGEIVGRLRDTSRQCDLIVYDKLNGVSLLYDDSVQVYPIDCVYGIIEVKSALSKPEFIDALNKIKAFKTMAPAGPVSQPLAGGWTTLGPRPRPFGIVFAYNLPNNSLDSLLENLREWEASTPRTLWPNYVCVLEVGVIYHHKKLFEPCFDSDQITAEASPISIAHREDSLFQFYCALHDMCAHMQLGPVELMRYYDPAVRIGKYVVDSRGADLRFRKDGGAERTVRFRESTIDKVVTWCAAHGRMSYGDTLMKRFGSLPLGMENAAILSMEAFLYNPNNLPGLHEAGPNAFTVTENGVTANACLVNVLELTIDDRRYVIAMSGFTEADYEDVGTHWPWS
jgi:hypothetical protein